MVPLVSGALALSAGAQIASSIMGSNAAKDAAAAAARAEQRALDFQKEQWNTTQKNIQPWIKAGTEGLAEYQNLARTATQPTFNYQIQPFQFSTYSDPGAQYRMAQATKALNNSSIAKGLSGGGALKAIMAKNQEMAGQAYGDAWNRYLENTKLGYGAETDKYNRNLGYQNAQLERQKDLFTTGGTMASGLGTIGTQYAKNVGDTMTAQGASAVSGILGSQNAISQGLTGLSNAAMQALPYFMKNQTNANLGGAV